MEDHNVVLELDEDVIVHGTHGKLVKALPQSGKQLIFRMIKIWFLQLTQAIVKHILQWL